MDLKEKQLLLYDLCARLPYHPIVYVNENLPRLKLGSATRVWEYIGVDKPCKPYLRPLSSMTEEEMEELLNIDKKRGIYSSRHLTWHIDGEIIDYLNKKMFDWRGLIPMDLALEAPEGMYN